MREVLRDAAIQALLIMLRLMVPVTAIAGVLLVIAAYTLMGAACFYGAAWLVSTSLDALAGRGA